ncbi:CHAT domain-containing protein [Kitasatospora sp. NPDC088351]|uniref:CHAT domain-containing protein n=1 Tax=Kitasatospora sp. NPDC088351 TaxID=3155180 RepID=UPI00343E1F8A
MAEQDLNIVLEPEALVEALRLGEVLREDEECLAAYYLLGWFHAVRYHALPEGVGQSDYEQAIQRFTPCFVFGADTEDLPQDLLPDVARRAMDFAGATHRRLVVKPSHEVLSRLIGLLRRITTSIPQDEPEHAEALSNLAVALKSRFELGRDPTDLDSAVDTVTGALNSVGPEHPRRPMLLSNLAAVLLARFEWSGAPSDLDEAVETGLSAVHTTDGSSLSRGGAIHNLATALKARFVERGDPADLDAAIEAFKEAEAAHTDSFNKAGSLFNLGASLRNRYEHTGVLADLDAALNSSRAAVETASADHPGRPVFLSGFGHTLLSQFECTGDPVYLERSIDVLREALEHVPLAHRDHPLRLSSLGNALLARHDITGCASDLEEAIELHRAAVQEAWPQQTNYNAVVNNLAISLWRRFERFGDSADLDRAISVGRASAEATAAGHVDRTARMSNVGLMLWTRFKHSGSLSDLDASIEFADAAVEAAPAGHHALAGMLSNLGVALLERYMRTTEPRDLDDAIRTSRRAVAITHGYRPDRPRYLANLCGALYARFRLARSADDLADAIEAGHGAVDAIPLNHPERPRYLSALGVALTTRAEESGSAADLDDAVAACQEALDATPAEHPEHADYGYNLGQSLQRRYDRTCLRQDLDRALRANLEASRTDGARPSTRIQAARAAAALARGFDRDLEASLLADAVGRLPEVADRRLSRGDRQHAVGEWSGLAGEAAASALASGAGSPADRATRALQLLETGRGVLLGQALDTRSDLAELRHRHPGLAQRFEELRNQLDQPLDIVTTPENPMPPATVAVRAVDATEHRRSLVDELNVVLGRIREQEGFAGFALPPAVDQLIAQAVFGPVVTFNVSPDRSDAILLTRDGIDSLHLPDLTFDGVLNRVENFHLALRYVSDPRVGVRTRKVAQQTVQGVLEWLWDAAVEPILCRLGFDNEPVAGEAWPRIWWAPGGILSLLPLHAAGYHRAVSGTSGGSRNRPTVMDRVVSSYTPTIRVLHHTRQHGTATPPASRSLIVAMPTTPGLEGRLAHVSAEVERVRALLPNPTLLIGADEAVQEAAQREAGIRPTRNRVLQHLPDCAIAHFACHGAHDSVDPSKSLLLLHDHERDPLTVASLAEVRLDSAQLVFLSACRTAFTDSAELIDEAIHLASAFQLAGFPHVIGTLWEINDELASTVAADFYAELGSGPTGDGSIDTSETARALHHTVRAMRDRFPESPSLWAAHLHVGV